ncbi:RsiV family protein [Amniculibacterium aquaticum]|uniref:RsiV family protein n=1 Tax=Amniculibacterium aquaticum TaxID=2479858 RepID=UPI000F59714F|nr:RsiV family protein [Amniculibacterium aquaticum]
MKKLSIALVLALGIYSCKKTVDPPKNGSTESKTEQVESFKIDSVKVADSVVVSKTLKSAKSVQVLVFPTLKNKTVLDSIYAPTQLKFEGYDKASMQHYLEKEVKTALSQAKSGDTSYQPDFEQTWWDNSSMKLVSNTNDILTLSYFGDGFSGGAHGYYFENYKVFDLKDNKVISQNDVFNNPKDAKWSKILMDHFVNKDQKEMLLVDKIELNNNFYFDKDQITFVYNQYEITAYAAGVVKISVPFKDIKADLKESFVQRTNSK